MLAIKNGRIYTVSDGVIENGTVLIDGDKIKAVGRNVRIPKGSDVIDATGKSVMPGIIDAHCHISVYQSPRRTGDSYDLNESTSPTTPHIRAIDALNPEDYAIKMARKSGFTTVCSLPGSTNICGGMGVVYKLKKAKTVFDMVIPGKEPMKFALGENPRSVFGKRNQYFKTRMGIAGHFREFLAYAKQYSDLKLEHEKDPSRQAPSFDFQLEAMVPVMRGEMTCRIHCHRADDIVTAIRVSEEFGLKYVLEHVTEGYKIVDFLKEKDPYCVVGPTATPPTKQELLDKSLENAAILSDAGLRVCLTSDSSYSEFLLPNEVGIAMAHGLSEEAAFKAVTVNPAGVLGISDRTGTLEVGKDADLAIFSGHPFSNLSRCEKTVISGVVYDNLKD